MANQFLTKQVAKATFDITSNYTASVTNAGGRFSPTDINATADTITIPNHIFNTGDVVSCITATGGTICTVPAAATNYWIINVDENTVKLANSLANARTGTNLTTLAAGAGAGYQYLIKGGIGASPLGITIPSTATITDAWFVVRTAFTGANVIGTALTTPTIALSTGQGAGDLVAAIDISTYPYSTTGVRGTLVTAPNLGADAAHDTALEVIALVDAIKILMTADAEAVATVAVASLVGGKLDLYIEYVL